MINITDKISCCGCNACGDVCPKGSISFQTDLFSALTEKTCYVIYLREQ